MYEDATHGSFDESAAEFLAVDEEAQARQFSELLEQATAGFIADLENEAMARVRGRVHFEQKWLSALRQFHGLYDELTQGVLDKDVDRSSIFVNLTRPKCTAWAARLGDMLFPNDDKNWGLNATPVPELAQVAKDALKAAAEKQAQAEAAMQQHNEAADAGADPAQLAQLQDQALTADAEAADNKAKEEAIRSELEMADQRAEAMSREIDDQLKESRYAAVCRDVIDDATKLGVGILKGPLTSTKPRRRWERAAAQPALDGTPPAPGDFTLTQNTDPRPIYRRTNPWHFFPDPDATCMEDNEDSYERHLLSKSGLRRMAKALGFDRRVVAEIVKDAPSPTSGGDMAWLTSLRLMERATESAIINRYVVWEYHGPMPREHVLTMLTTMGEIDRAEKFRAQSEADEEPMVIVYFCQGRLLKIEEYFPLDSGETLYSVFPFEKAEATIMGADGVPWLMRHEQAMLNGAVRMMMDNGALSVGPQIVIDKMQVEPEDGNWKMRPRKVWLKKGQDVNRDQKPFETFNIPMNQQQLAGIIQLALQFIDDVISMPNIAQGEQGAHVTQTSSGMSMLFNSANVVFRRVVKNWDDDLTTPTIRRAFDWNMQFNDKDDIKGDMQAEARGTSVLLVREVQSQQLMVIAQNWSTHPVIGPAIRIYETLRMTLQALNITPEQILCSKDEFEQRIAKAAEASDGQESPDMIRAQAQLQVAQIDADSRKLQGENQMQIAELNQKTEILKLVQKDGVDLKQIDAMLQGKALDLNSKERMFAAEAAMEARNAAEARARGEEPTGSGGFISAGSKPA